MKPNITKVDCTVTRLKMPRGALHFGNGITAVLAYHPDLVTKLFDAARKVGNDTEGDLDLADRNSTHFVARMFECALNGMLDINTPSAKEEGTEQDRMHGTSCLMVALYCGATYLRHHNPAFAQFVSLCDERIGQPREAPIRAKLLPAGEEVETY